MQNSFEKTFVYKVIYVFRINDENHRDLLKIGDSTLKSDLSFDKFEDNCLELNQSALERIKSYTGTAGIKPDLLYTSIAVKKIINEKGELEYHAFRDHDVHFVLKNSGIQKKDFGKDVSASEWFECDLKTAINAIKATKEDRLSLTETEKSKGQSPVVFRPEQEKAISNTLKVFAKGNKMLWNAKMRFGKTLTALQVAKESGFKKTIIITHRPVVEDGWFEDFDKIFFDRDDFEYGSKEHTSIDRLLTGGKNFVYFASMQDLRGSKEAGGAFEKNKIIFDTIWDFVVVDEAHEGTKTELGDTVLKKIIKSDFGKTKELELSGTPFNLLYDYKENEIFTWDYVMEQQAKADWYRKNPECLANPYEGLPQMHIFTYDLSDVFTNSDFVDLEDKAFNFREFFRTWTGDPLKDGNVLPEGARIGGFVHKDDIWNFLNLLSDNSKNSNYPFSTEEYRKNFKHTLWMVPGVKEARALSEMLQSHPVFGQRQFFKIINVAGDGDEEDYSQEALSKLRDGIKEAGTEGYTITLSCGKLTTGVTVKEWSAVLMLAGSYSTSASGYLQTIFRVQSPANINGRIKQHCFVFDFAPDRTLKMVAEATQISAKAGGQEAEKKNLKSFLNFCPVIGMVGSKMNTYDVDYMMGQLKKAYIDRVVKTGFEDSHIYDNKMLMNLTDGDMSDFEHLKSKIGTNPAQSKITQIDIADNGVDGEEQDDGEDGKKPKRKLTPEEIAKRKEHQEKLKKRKNAINILNGISVRIPLLAYGADFNDPDNNQKFTEMTRENIIDIVDDISWEEFMPKGVTKDEYKKFIKYYDPDIFKQATKQIRNSALSADQLPVLERTKKIAGIFEYFKNPDKETVLTPWRVVNKHLSDTIGGYSFFDKDDKEALPDEIEPRFIDRGKVTHDVFDNPNTRILEINSKSGLYPLYVSYSAFKRKLISYSNETITRELEQEIWDYVIEHNIYVICKTRMARSITKRTLLGFRNKKWNAHNFDDLIMQIKDKPQKFIDKISSPSFWKQGGTEKMKFNAIVGNPPYQVMDGGAQASAMPIYHYFVQASIKAKPDYISLIMPSRWMTGGKGLDQFRNDMINDKHVLSLFDYFDGKQVFPNVDIKGGVCYFLRDSNKEDKCEIHSITNQGIVVSQRYLVEDGDDIFIRDERLLKIKEKIASFGFQTFDNIVSASKPYGLRAETMLRASKYGLPDFSETEIKDGYKVLGLGEKARRTWKFIPKDYPLPRTNVGLDKYKVFIAEAYGSGAIGEVPSAPVLGTPGELCTETFLQIGPFDSAIEAKNVIQYVHTKVFRLLVGIQKQTQHTTQKAYRFVPVLDFSCKSEIPWNKSIEELDQYLYEFFKLSEGDIEFIENTIPSVSKSK